MSAGQAPGRAAGRRRRRLPLGPGVAAGIAALVLTATPAHGDVVEYLGRTLVDIRIEIGGVAITSPSVLQLIETRLGQPLTMTDVRETIEHLVGLGRFEDVRVFADRAATPPDGVVLRWSLVPVQRIAAVEVVGSPGLDEGTLRGEIEERHGTRPPGSRVPDIIRQLTEYYAERGYPRPVIEPRLASTGASELATLTLTIEAGPRTVVGDAAVRGESGRTPDDVLGDLGLERGRPYDRVAIEARVLELERELGDAGFYEADLDLATTFDAGGTVAAVTVTVDRGPRVRVVFTGDALPEGQRNELVPIRRERSVDLDLLEDASRNIEAYLRQQGYRAAVAPYVREAAGSEMVLTFTIARGPMHRVRSVEVAGNRSVPLAELAPLLALQPGDPFTDGEAAATAASIAELYRVRGFAQAAVKAEVTVLPPRQEAAGPLRPVDVRLVVTEGPRTLVGDVTIVGARDIAEPRLRALVDLATGSPFYRPRLEADRDAIERQYQNEGYRAVRVTARTDVLDDGRRIDVRWTIAEGPQTLVDHVLVTGNARTSDELIRRTIPLQPGLPLGADALVESQRRLAELGLFRRIRITELPHGSSQNRDIIVDVEEAPSTTIAYGGGLEAGRRVRLAEDGQRAEERIEIAPRGFFEVSRRNLFGKNRSVSLLTRVSFRPRDPAVAAPEPRDAAGYGFNEYRIVGTFREPRLLDTPGDVQLTAFIEQAIRSSFNFARRGVRAEYARRLRPAVTVSGRYALDRTRLFDEKIDPEDQLLIDRLFPRVRLSTFTGSLLRDSRDDVLDPEGGIVLGVDASLAARSVGSEVGFVKSFVQVFGYRRLPGASRLTLAAGFRLGLAVGFARPVERRAPDGTPILGPDGQPIVDIVDDVPASERFFAGGDTTVRGFVLDRLGTDETRNDEGFPTGGNGLAVLNLELRTPYWKGLGGVGFFDAGNVFKSAADIRLHELRPTAGFGMRYRSPLGPLRVDLGFNLDRQSFAGGGRERGTVFHISLGQAF